jgi:hypothetical protein
MTDPEPIVSYSHSGQRMKYIIFFILLCIIFFLGLFLNQKIIWCLYLLLLAFLLISRQKLVFKPVSILNTLTIPLIWTIILSYSYSFYSNIQGLFYLSIPMIMIVIGYQISKYLSLKKSIIFILCIGTLLSIIYISIVIFKVGFSAFLSPYEKARFVVGSGSPASILGLVISLYSEKYGIKVFRTSFEKIIFIIINLVAVYLFASRTYWIVLLIFIIIFNIKVIIRHQAFLFLLLVVGIVILIIFPVKLTGEITTTRSLLFKIFKTFSEIKFSNYKSYSDINVHYRGYEAYRAFMTYLSGNPINLIFGNGLGKPVDLKASVYLAGSYRTIIPWIHNGYFFILVKEGAMGLLALFLFFFQVFNFGFKNLGKIIDEKRFMSLMIIGSVFSMILTNYVICSMFTVEMAIILITIGAFIQMLSQKSNTEKKLPLADKLL